MSDLALTTRLAMLHRNLEQVASILTDAARRSAEISKLRRTLLEPGGIEESIEAIQGSLGSALYDLKPFARRVEGISPIVEKIDQVLTGIEATLHRIDECRADLFRMLDRQVEIGGGGAVDKTLQDRLVNQATQKIRAVKRITKTIRGPAVTPAALEKAWADYRSLLQSDSEPLFAEYVDVLRGLALRETGLEEGLCGIIEKLLYKCGHVGSVRWESLTIPARRADLELTVARLIRLGFPEWTLWALPLAAYELGHVVVSEHPDLVRFRAAKTANDEEARHLESCQADAYATYSMGPAYACAALLLQFDPKDPLHVERAVVILGMLKSARQEQASYHEIIKRLEQEWSEALVQAKSDPVSLDVRQRLDGWVQYHIEFFQSYAFHATYRDQDWGLAVTCAPRLAEPEPGFQDLRQEDLRLVLNAAWLCRTTRPGAAKLILDNAMTLWKELSKPSESGPSLTSVTYRKTA